MGMSDQSHSVCDTVSRRVDVYDEHSKMRYGIVLSRYTETDSSGHFYPELYKVLWNDGEERKGYLRHGLDAVSIPGELWHGKDRKSLT